MKMKILAVDPGLVTGVAVWGWHSENTFGALEMPHFEFLDWAALHIEQKIPNLVVCESFIITYSTLQKTRGENWSLEQIGVLRWLCKKWGVEFQLQTPADAKSFSTDSKLRTAGFWTPGKGHANDAARHLLLALVRQKMFDPVVFAR